MKIYDKDGTERDWAWLQATFGQGVRVDARPDTEKAGYVVRELRAKEGPCTIVVNVRDKDNVVQGGIDVARWWDDGGLPALPANLATWKTIGIFGPTNAGGDVGFGMGQGDGYDPHWEPEKLPVSEVWATGNSERVHGLGWVWATNHLHLDVVFQYVEGDGEPGEPPGDDEIAAKLERIADAVSATATLLADVLEAGVLVRFR